MRREKLRALLSEQPDFKNVKAELQEEVERPSFWPKMPPGMHVCGNVLGTCETLLQTALWEQYNYFEKKSAICPITTIPYSWIADFFFRTHMEMDRSLCK